MLLLAFSELKSTAPNSSWRLVASVRTRASVDDQGQISGILASETISGRLDSGISKLAERRGGFADILGTVKRWSSKSRGRHHLRARRRVGLCAYRPLELKAASGPGPAAKLTPIAGENALAGMVAQRFQTMARDLPSPAASLTSC